MIDYQLLKHYVVICFKSKMINHWMAGLQYSGAFLILTDNFLGKQCIPSSILYKLFPQTQLAQ